MFVFFRGESLWTGDTLSLPVGGAVTAGGAATSPFLPSVSGAASSAVSNDAIYALCSEDDAEILRRALRTNIPTLLRILAAANPFKLFVVCLSPS